jgi:hypothetical protein
VTAPVRTSDIALDPAAVFIARAEAKAMLWANGEVSLHDAIDSLWAAAVDAGLVAEFGANQVQELLADIFAQHREDLAHEREIMSAREAATSCLTDELRVQELCRDPDHVPKPTLDAAEYLLQLGDLARWKAWFERRTPAQRAAILQHLEQHKKKGRDR